MGLLFVTHLLAGTTMADAAQKEITVGTVEDVIMLPWGVKLPARIDTGAAKSSLDARELSIESNTVAVFKLPDKHGGTRIRLPIVEWRHVRTNEGLKKRPIVEIELCVGTKRLRTQVALDNRSEVKYPLLIGRNTLKGSFVVDVKRKHLLPPKCEVSHP